MPEQLLDRILIEIRDRLDVSRAAYDESRRLEAALDALGRDDISTTTPQATTRSRSRRPQARSSRSARAPRGQNLRLIRAAVSERPGATSTEIVKAGRKRTPLRRSKIHPLF